MGTVRHPAAALLVAAFLALPAVAGAQAINIHSFVASEGGASAGPLIQGTDGNFYGAHKGGGPGFWDSGTVFKMTPAGDVTVLQVFEWGNDISTPAGGLIQARDGLFYGVTEYARWGQGSVFKMSSTGSYQIVFLFSPFFLSPLYPTLARGAHPMAGLVEASDGVLYGTTSKSFGTGLYGYDTVIPGGTIYKLTVQPGGAVSYALLHDFKATPSYGLDLRSALIEGLDGNLYGTAVSGGDADKGTLFKMTPDGVVTRLHSFNGRNGEYPENALVEGLDGNFYGTTGSGGQFGLGVAFRLTPGGVFTLLHSFKGGAAFDGAGPRAALVRSSDLHFYGTTGNGGTFDGGTIFRMTAAGDITVLYHFTNLTDGGAPWAALVQAADGSFYGTARLYGASGGGVAFRMLDPADCDNSLSLSETNGALTIHFRQRSTVATTFSTWLSANGTATNLWSEELQPVMPTAFFDVPVQVRVPTGNIVVSSSLATRWGVVCEDRKRIYIR